MFDPRASTTFWFAADRYEGEWRNGLEHGVGTFIGADGSTFYGPWSGGKMHGQIVSICHD